MEEAAGSSCVPDDSTIRILLLGRSGSGKSSSGNTILGQKAFTSPKRYKEKVTRTSEEHTADVGGRKVCVIDTPDLLDPDLSEDELDGEKEKLLSLCQSGLHAVLLVLPVGKGLQNEEEMLEFTKDLLGSDLQRFTMVLFTRGDELEDGEKIERVIRREGLQHLVDRCSGVTHVFNREHDDGDQVMKLLQKIDTMVTRNEGRFTIKIRRNRIVDFALQVSKNLTQEKITEFMQLLKEEEEKLSKVRLVLLGKTGVGKSASGNTILGRNVFKSEVGAGSQTDECQAATKQRCGRQITVIDTPGIFSSKLSEEQTEEAILKCMAYTSPGPHAFLIVINLAARFTPEEREAVEFIRTAFGEQALKYTMILFTHLDSLESKTIKDYIKEDKSYLRDLVQRCGRRYHCLNNKSCSYPQLKELLKKIDGMVSQNGGSFYTDEMLQKVEIEVLSQISRLAQRKMKTWIKNLRKGINRTAEVLNYLRKESIHTLILSNVLGTILVDTLRVVLEKERFCPIQ